MSIPLPFPNINDTDINDVQTWSSSKILDYLKPALEIETTKTIEKTGAEVTFNIDPDTCEITKAVIEILPSQQGSGVPSPSNPRTINTFDTVHITQHNADNTESTSYDISLGETVCSINGDAVTGDFESAYAVKTFDYTSDWKYENLQGGNFYVGMGSEFEGTQYGATIGFLCNLSKPSNTSSATRDTCLISTAKNFNFTWGQTLGINSAQGFKDYLQNNDITIVVCARLATSTAITADPITSDLYEGTNVIGCAPAGTVNIEITCTDTIGNILKKEGIL